MPIFEYQCRKCGHRFERLQKSSTQRVRTCPECKARRVERMTSAPAIRFKGSGFYITDYTDKGKEPKKAEASGGGEKSKKDSDTSKGSGDSSSSSKSAPENKSGSGASSGAGKSGPSKSK